MIFKEKMAANQVAYKRQPIRILHFPGNFEYGGISTFLMNIYRNIDRSLVQFDFAVPRNTIGPYDDEVRSLGGRVFHIPRIRAGLNIFFKSIRTLLDLASPIDAIHIHSVHNAVITLYAMKHFRIGIRYYHSHNTVSKITQKWPLHRLIEKVMSSYIVRYSSRLFACSDDAARFLYGRWALENSKVLVLKNGIDVNNYLGEGDIDSDYWKALGLQKNSFVIGNVARLSPEKNHSMLLKILVSLRNKTNAHLVIVGDGPLRQSLIEIAEKNGISAATHFVGAKYNIAPFLKMFSVFVLPSLFEGMPMALLEAQAAGLPCVVSSAIPSAADLRLGIVRYCSLERNSDYWADEIMAAASLQRPIKSLIREKTIEGGFDIKTNARVLENIYLNDILSKKKINTNNSNKIAIKP